MAPALRERGPGRPRRPQLPPRSLPPPDRPRDRDDDRLAEESPSRLGSADDPFQAAQGTARASLPLIDLSMPRASPADRTQAPQTKAAGLQALGTLPADGPLADGRD